MNNELLCKKTGQIFILLAYMTKAVKPAYRNRNYMHKYIIVKSESQM